MKDPLSFRGNVQLVEEALNVLQSELDPETLCAVKPGKRILICGSALSPAAAANDPLSCTAEAPLRVMVIELMGHNACCLALTAGVAGGADIILIPEIP